MVGERWRTEMMRLVCTLQDEGDVIGTALVAVQQDLMGNTRWDSTLLSILACQDYC